MAEDMIERAMNALRQHSYPKPYPDEMARALAAALDPEDEALVEFIAKAHAKEIGIPDGAYPDGDAFWRDMLPAARTAVNAIKAFAQGVSVSQEQVREKD